jgi:hypothetical protein
LLTKKTETHATLHFRTPETRFHLSTEARNTIQEAALNVQTAQAMLPGVQFPYCTTREISAVLHVSTPKRIGDRGEFVYKSVTVVNMMLDFEYENQNESER